MFKLIVDKAIFEPSSQVGPGQDFFKVLFLKNFVSPVLNFWAPTFKKDPSFSHKYLIR